MQRLIEGFRRFRETYYREHRAVFDALVAHGQWPRAMVIGCADSRVDPQLIFGAAPGDIFVVRNVANLVPPYRPDGEHHSTSAALEFAVNGLQVEHIVVLGHARCGGIAALVRGRPGEDAAAGGGGGDFIAPWIAIAAPARARAVAAGGPPEAVQRACEHEAIKVSLGNLMTFPWIRERVGRGALALHGWYFDLERGDLLRLGDAGAFEPAIEESRAGLGPPRRREG